MRPVTPIEDGAVGPFRVGPSSIGHHTAIQKQLPDILSDFSSENEDV